MLQRLTIQSVKSFLSESVISFAPVTLITGTNSSGKSTVFQTLLLIKQAFEHPALSLDGMHLNGPQASVGAYDDWCSKHQQEQVRVAVEISNGSLTTRPDLRRTLLYRHARRATAPVLWWADRTAYGRRLRWDISVSGELDMTFVPSAESPNDARLKQVSWSAKAERGDEVSSYTLSVNAAAPTEDEFDSAELDENDAERYRYAMTSRHSWAGTVPTTPRTNGPDYCAVEGLLPTSVLRATSERAATVALADQMANVFAWARSNDGGPPDRESPLAVNKQARRISQILVSPTKARLRWLAVRASDAERSKARLLLGAVGDQRLAKAIVDRFVSQWKPAAASDEEIVIAAQQTADALLAMALRLIATRAPDACEMPEQLNASMESNAASIIDRDPLLGVAVRFLLEAARLSGDRNLRERVAAALELAAKHASANRFQLQPMSAEVALRDLVRSEDAHLPFMAPSENAARRYFVECLFHLGPLRDEPRVLYVADVPVAPHDVGKRGQRAISCLREFGRETVEFPMPQHTLDERTTLKRESLQLSEVVSLWGQYLGIFDGLQIDTSEKYGTVVKVKGVMDGASIAPDLTNVGVGVSQVLPILILCAAMPVGGCALIEQPELHLHPSVQSRLAVFFAACAMSGRQVVLESHSEHLVNRMRLMIALQELQADDVSVVFVERDDYGATAAPVRILPDGSLERWPRGFLDEAERVLAALMRTRTTFGAR